MYFKDFINSFNVVAGEVHQNAVDKGFWEVLDPEKWLKDRVGIMKPSDIDYNHDSMIEAFKAGQDNPLPNKGEKIALMHSELSEMLEGVRKPSPDKHCPEFTNEEIELADAIIRAMDYAKKLNLRLPEAIIAKHEYNTSRPYKHGKKF